MEKDNTEKEIEEALKIPFDYGSEEYLSVREKILKNREKYRKEKAVQDIMKYKYIKGIFENE